MTRKIAGFVLFVVLAMVLAACGNKLDSSGGSGGGSTAPSVTRYATAEDIAASEAVTGACSTSSNGAGETVNFGYESSAEIDPGVKQGVLEYVAARILERLQSNADSGKFAKGFGKARESFTFNNERIFNPNGAGSITIDGELTIDSTEDSDSASVSILGDLSIWVAAWEESVTVQGKTYDVVTDGTWIIGFDGLVGVAFAGSSTIYNIDFITTVNGDDIRVSGDVSGSATIDGFSISLVGSDTDNLAATCSGSVYITTESGTTSCTFANNCSSCDGY